MHQHELIYCGFVPTAVDDIAPVEFLQLVADPVRWQLQRELTRSDRRVSELCELVGKPQSLVSYHLRELRDAGLVSARRSAADGRDTYYRASVGRFTELMRAASEALHPAAQLELATAAAPRATGGRRQRVLFLCTGNSARSQMAEALLDARSGGAFVAQSAGSRPKPLHPLAVRVMAERGIDISDNRTKHFDRFREMNFDGVITLCDKVKEVCPEFPGQPITAHWSIADPSAIDDGNDYDAFVRTADEIDERVGLLIAQLTADPPRGRKRT